MQPFPRFWLLPVLALTLAGVPSDYPKGYFQSPLGIPLSLSGSFAEMRSNHFHTGLDIRTNGQTGYRVYAAADGWIARIAVSPGGYGNALYVNHPNGFQTVYAHLDRFESAVTDYVRSAQYARRSFQVDLYPEEGRFPVSAGEVIALSGNSGSSGGPHLHFEIRETATAHPVNPLLFGLPVDDTTRPRIFRVKLYPMGSGSRVRVLGAGGRVLQEATEGASVVVPVSSIGPDRYGLESGIRLQAAGRIGFGIQAHDYHERSSSRLGAFRIRLQADERTVFQSEMEKLDFALNRYLNAHVDYAEQIRNGRWVQRSYLLPGNRLPIYRTDRGGTVTFAPGDTVTMRYRVEDTYENAVSLAFPVVGIAPVEGRAADSTLVAVSWNRESVIERDGLVVRIPQGALYDDLELRLGMEPGPAGALSPAYGVQDEETPLHAAVTVSIPAGDVPESLRDRVVMARRTARGRLVSEGGTWADGMLTARTRNFGTYVIAADTTAPQIRPLNISDGASMTSAGSIRIRISDDLAGIASFEGRVDGEWVLFAYDAKSNLIEYVFDGRVSRGSHVLEVAVTDGVGNVGTYRARFTR